MSSIRDLGKIWNESVVVWFCGLVNCSVRVERVQSWVVTCLTNDESQNKRTPSRHLLGGLRKTIKISVTVAGDLI
jgi:hypothetical protein